MALEVVVVLVWKQTVKDVDGDGCMSIVDVVVGIVVLTGYQPLSEDMEIYY